REPERIVLKTETSGLYRIEIRASNKGASGPYRIILEQLRDATPDDAKRLTASKAFDEGNRLESQMTKEALGEALEQFRSSAALFHEVGDVEREADALYEAGQLHAIRSEIPAAVESYNQSLTLTRTAQIARGEAAALNGLGEVYVNTGEQHRAIDAFN